MTKLFPFRAYCLSRIPQYGNEPHGKIISPSSPCTFNMFSPEHMFLGSGSHLPEASDWLMYSLGASIRFSPPLPANLSSWTLYSEPLSTNFAYRATRTHLLPRDLISQDLQSFSGFVSLWSQQHALQVAAVCPFRSLSILLINPHYHPHIGE